MTNGHSNNGAGGGDEETTERADYLDLLLARFEHDAGQTLEAVRQIRTAVPGASPFRRRAISQFFERRLRQQAQLDLDYAEVMLDYTAAMTVALARR